MNTPPHLPRKTCNIEAHKTLKSIWGLLFLVFIATITSLAFTMASLVWFAPTFIPEQFITTVQKGSQANTEDSLDLEVLNKVKQRLWNIYDKRQKIDGKFYSDEADKLQAVMFSSDGWAVVYAPNYWRGLETYWEGIDYQGSSYEIEKVYVDSVSQLTYVKFAGDGFPFISFANWDNIMAGNTVWELYNNQRKQHILEKPVAIETARRYPIWQPRFFYFLDNADKAGSLVINENGELVGLLDKDNKLIYGWMIDSQYGFILQDGEPDYQILPWSGYMVHGYLQEDNFTRRVAGFYVENSPTRVTSSTIGIGDIITRVQNNLVDGESLPRQILAAPNEFPVTVLRENQEFEIIVEKEKLQ